MLDNYYKSKVNALKEENKKLKREIAELQNALTPEEHLKKSIEAADKAKAEYDLLIEQCKDKIKEINEILRNSRTLLNKKESEFTKKIDKMLK